jgi:hypothetical protein
MAHIYLKIHVFDAIKLALHAMVHQQHALIVILVLFMMLQLLHVKIVPKIVYNAIKLHALHVKKDLFPKMEFAVNA